MKRQKQTTNPQNKKQKVRINHDLLTDTYWKTLRANTNVYTVYKLFKKFKHAYVDIDIMTKSGVLTLNEIVIEEVEIYKDTVHIKFENAEIWIDKDEEYKWIYSYHENNYTKEVVLGGVGVIGIRERSPLE